MERNPPVRAWLRPRSFVHLPLLLFLQLALAPCVNAQGSGPIFKAPDQVVERIVTAQALACQIADTASSHVLAGLDLALQRLIQEQEALVRETVADSAPGLAAEKTLAESEARLKPLEAQLDPLLTRRNEINSAQQIYEDSIAAATQGDAPPGSKPRLQELEDEIQGYNDEHARFDADLKKITDADDWLQGRDEQLKAAMEENRIKWARARDERRGLVRRIHTARFNPQYQALVREEETLDIRIAELQDKVKPLREARDAAKRTLADVNLENVRKLEQLHEINGFIYQYLSYARDCVERRRGELAQAVPPPAAGQPGAPAVDDVLSGTAVGRWSVGCSFKEGYSADKVYTDGGAFNVVFDGAGGVSGTFVSSTGQLLAPSYAVVGTVVPDPDPLTGRRARVEYGQGAGAGWSMTWDGQFNTISGQFGGHGTPRLQFDKWGGGNCSGAWSIP